MMKLFLTLLLVCLTIGTSSARMRLAVIADPSIAESNLVTVVETSLSSKGVSLVERQKNDLLLREQQLSPAFSRGGVVGTYKAPAYCARASDSSGKHFAIVLRDRSVDVSQRQF